MRKKLTITIDEDIYESLHARVGRRRISQFVETLVRPYLLDEEQHGSYEELAADEAAEREAREWAEAHFEEWLHEAW